MLHPCFVSYVNPENPWAQFATEVTVKALKSALEVYFGKKRTLYIDEERLKPGVDHDKLLAQAICNSACMVVLYYPAYGLSDYCRRELEAMRLVEERRKRQLGGKLGSHRMFLPILLRGTTDELPEYLRQNCTYLDYSRQLLTAEDLSNREDVREKFFDAVATMHKLCGILEAPGVADDHDCSQAELPQVPEPARTGAGTPAFPGRG